MQETTKLDRLFSTCKELSAKFYSKLIKYEKLESNCNSWNAKLEKNYSSSKREKVDMKKQIIIGWLNGVLELNNICTGKDKEHDIDNILKFASELKTKSKQYERKKYKDYAIVSVFLDNAKKNINKQILKYKEYRNKSKSRKQSLYKYDSFFNFMANTKTYDGTHSFKFLTKYEGMKKIQSKLGELSRKLDIKNSEDNNEGKYGKDLIIAQLKIILISINNELATKLDKIGSRKGKIFTIMHMRDPLEKRIGYFPIEILNELKSKIESFNKESTEISDYETITKKIKELNENFSICKICGPNKSVFKSTTGLKSKDMDIIDILHLCSRIKFYSDARVILGIVGRTLGNVLLAKIGILPVAKNAYEDFEKS